jgi:predicted NACHT family NTPase
MIIEWLGTWVATKAAGLIFKTIFSEDFVKDLVKDYTKDFFKYIFKNVVTAPFKQEPLQKAVIMALTEFLQLMQQQLKVRCRLSEAEIKEYIPDINTFIRDKSVKEILGKAFDVDSDSLETKILEDSWRKLLLKPLPSKFNWQTLTEQYFTQVQEMLLESEELRYILEFQKLNRIEKNTTETAGIIPDFNLKQYQEAICECYANLKLDSIETTGYAYNELRLWRIFIPQNVREVHQVLPQVHELPKEHLRRLREKKEVEAEEIAIEELERHKRVYLEQPVGSVQKIIEDKQKYKYIVILGDPGSGKSTLLQYLALDWVEQTLDRLDKIKNLPPIPLLIELRTYMRRREDKECNNFLEFFHKCSGAITHLNQHKLQEQLKAGNALVMFDGLDEVFDPGKRENVITDIHRFTNEYPNVQVIVTSRVIGYKAQRLRDAEFKHFMLQDLEPEQIQDFINRWHSDTFTDKIDGERKKERLQRAIDTSNSIAELAGNPLLLTMMAILNRNQELPRDRAELYNQASRLLLHQWDVERALMEDKRLDPKTIDYKDKQAMLRQVAYHMQTSEKGLAGNLISANDLEKILTEYLKTIEVDKAREVARVMINQLRTRNFMLCFLGADYYAFVHRTFLEYFCAWEFVWQFKETRSLEIEELKTQVFGKHWQDETWHEVLRLIAGMIEPKFVGEILEYLMAQNGEGEKFSNLFLAAKCLSDVRNRTASASIATQLIERIKGLINYDNVSLKTAYTRDAQIYYTQVISIRTKAVAVVATTWKDDPNTLSWLKSRATEDKDEIVRGIAVHNLAQGWKDDPEILSFLKTSAQLGTPNVQQAAVLELAKGWKDDPDTLSILKACASASLKACTESSKYFFGARAETMRLLAKDWKDEPGIFELLCDRAVNDPFERQHGSNRNPRQYALAAIIEHYPHHPQTLPLLRDRAENDPDEQVQEFAQKKLAELEK